MVTVGHAYTGVALVGATSSLGFAFSAGAALSPALAGAVMQVRPDGGFALLMAGVIGAGLWALRDGKRTGPDQS
jgi:hypothetical protein